MTIITIASINKRFGVFYRMTTITESAGRVLADDPIVRLVAVDATEICFFEMSSVAPYANLTAMTGAETVRTLHLEFFMRVMTIMAGQAGHGPRPWKFTMTLETTFG